MPLYEHVFLARQDLAQAQVDALADNATKIITENNGTVVKTETWGLRSLAYRIAKNRKAHYVALDLDALQQNDFHVERSLLHEVGKQADVAGALDRLGQLALLLG